MPFVWHGPLLAMTSWKGQEPGESRGTGKGVCSHIPCGIRGAWGKPSCRQFIRTLRYCMTDSLNLGLKATSESIWSSSFTFQMNRQAEGGDLASGAGCLGSNSAVPIPGCCCAPLAQYLICAQLLHLYKDLMIALPSEDCGSKLIQLR